LVHFALRTRTGTFCRAQAVRLNWEGCRQAVTPTPPPPPPPQPPPHTFCLLPHTPPPTPPPPPTPTPPHPTVVGLLNRAHCTFMGHYHLAHFPCSWSGPYVGSVFSGHFCGSPTVMDCSLFIRIVYYPLLATYRSDVRFPRGGLSVMDAFHYRCSTTLVTVPVTQHTRHYAGLVLYLSTDGFRPLPPAACRRLWLRTSPPPPAFSLPAVTVTVAVWFNRHACRPVSLRAPTRASPLPAARFLHLLARTPFYWSSHGYPCCPHHSHLHACTFALPSMHTPCTPHSSLAFQHLHTPTCFPSLVHSFGHFNKLWTGHKTLFGAF